MLPVVGAASDVDSRRQWVGLTMQENFIEKNHARSEVDEQERMTSAM